MADTIGRAEIEVDFDTHRLPAQGKRATRQAGKAGEASGDAFNDGFTKVLKKEMPDAPGKALESGEGRVERIAERVGRRTGGKFSDSFEKETRNRLRKSFSGSRNPFNVLDDQAKAIATIIAATFAEASGLFSGLSADIVAVAAGLFQAAGGLSAIAATLPGIIYGFALASNGLGRVEELAPKAAKGIDNLKDAFENADVPFFMREWEESLANFTNKLAESLRFDQIATNLGKATAQITDAFADIIGSPAWTSFVTAMETSIPDAIVGFGTGLAGLTSAFLSFAAAAGPAAFILGAEFAKWGQSIADAVQAANESGALTQWLIDAGETLGLVLDLVGELGQGLFYVFEAAAPSAQIILGYLAQLATQFSDWAQSLEGQSALAAWFEQGVVVLTALAPLIGAVATSLADLVTPEVIAQLVTFINSLTSLIPIVTQVLGLFSDLNVLGIVAALFDAIRVALEPVMPQLSELATVLGEALITAIVGLSPLLTTLVQAIADILTAITPILPPLATLIAELGEQLAPVIADLAPIIVDLIEAFAPLIPQLVDALIPAIETMTKALGPTIEILGSILPPILAIVIAGFKPMISTLEWLNANVLPKVNDLLDLMTGIMKALRPVWDAITTAIKNSQRPFQVFIDALNDGKSAGEAFGDAVGAAFQWVKDTVEGLKNALRNIRWPSPPAWLTNGISNLPGLSALRQFATGGVVTGPTRALIGEAGPEMVVPLARPLSQVDPAVRDVAAYAQGKMTNKNMASGGIAGQGVGGGGVTVEQLTVVSPWANNPRLVADDILDALVEAGK